MANTIYVDTDRESLAGIRILCLSDTHDLQQFMPSGQDNLPPVDIIIHAGDFTVRGTSEEVLNFKSWMESLLEKGVARHVVVVAGNHELSFQPWKAKHQAVRLRQEEVKHSLISVPNLYYLEDSSITLMGLCIHGSPWTTPICGKMEWAFQDRDKELRTKWDLIPEKDCVDIVVTHCPPYGQGDELHHSCPGIPLTKEKDNESAFSKPMSHVGSQSLLDKIMVTEPLLHIFGHFHEGYGVTKKTDCRTLFVNAAICDEDYQPQHAPIVLEFKLQV